MTTLLIGSVASADDGAVDAFMRWANVSEPWELWLVAFGICAQMLFFGRWLVQWVASERRGESHMPDLFWWLSLVGASLLLIYFILRGEPVGVLGQSVGWLVYGRNLHLLRKARRATIAPDEPID